MKLCKIEKILNLIKKEVVMDRYWIGISGGVQRVNEINQKSWWCFPKDAIKGDSILLYCPRSISPKKQGIYALYHLISDLVEDHKYNFYCGGFGSDLGRSVKLFYGEIELEKKYEHTLTAKEMKNDAALSKAGF